MQIPIGLENKHEGVVDLVDDEGASTSTATNGENVRVEEIPAALRTTPRPRARRCSTRSRCSPTSSPRRSSRSKVTEELIHDAVRKGTLSQKLTPVFMGSAYKNKGVQLLLDAVTRYLPSPLDVENTAVDLSNDEAPIALASDPNKPLVTLAFKLEDGRYGQLTYLRVYQGRIGRGASASSTARTKRRHKVGRLVRMHADEMEDIEEAFAGDIVAMFGIDCASGDTFTDESIQVAMSSMHVPGAGDLALDQADGQQGAGQHGQGARALRRARTRPSTPASTPRAAETIISGMGELHLEVYVERMKREYGVEVADRRAAGRLPRDDLRSAPSSAPRTRSRPAARASTARSRATSSRSRTATSSSWTRCAAARSRPSSSRPSRRASARRSRRAA